jgi:hypothetical protein
MSILRNAVAAYLMLHKYARDMLEETRKGLSEYPVTPARLDLGISGTEL